MNRIGRDGGNPHRQMRCRVEQNALARAKNDLWRLWRNAIQGPLSPSGQPIRRGVAFPRLPAGVVELVDTLGLGPSGLLPLGVRVPPPAPGTVHHLVIKDIDGRSLCKLLKPLPKV